MDRRFWRDRYRKNELGWDIGYVSPAIKKYIDQLTDKTVRILLPGAGRGYEAAYLWKCGFRQTKICEWAPEAVQMFKTLQPQFPDSHILVEDFFKLDLVVDLILEQTFFCAIPPAQRPDYARQCASLLSKGGTLAGLLFATPFEKPGPPFGGTKDEYLKYFTPYFHIRQMDITPYSIPARRGNELFIELIKK